MNRRFSLVVILVLVGVLLPLKATAQEQQVSQREATVCEQRSSRLEAFREKFVEKQLTLEQRGASLLSSVEVRRGEIDEVLAETKSNYDERYQAWFDGYVSETEDEEKRAAAAVFYDDLKQLLASRRDAYQTARVAFRSQLDQIRAQRFNEKLRTAETFRLEAEAAFSELQSACNGRGRDNAQARQGFVKGLREARLTYAQSRRDQTPYREQIQDAVRARNQAFEEARKTFELGFQQLLSTFRETDESI